MRADEGVPRGPRGPKKDISKYITRYLWWCELWKIRFKPVILFIFPIFWDLTSSSWSPVHCRVHFASNSINMHFSWLSKENCKFRCNWKWLQCTCYQWKTTLTWPPSAWIYARQARLASNQSWQHLHIFPPRETAHWPHWRKGKAHQF